MRSAPAPPKKAPADSAASNAQKAGAGASAQAAAAQTDSAEATASEKPATKKIVAVTACPTGIAHTYMAADALKYAAEDLGYDFKVETQGLRGTKPSPKPILMKPTPSFSRSP